MPHAVQRYISIYTRLMRLNRPIGIWLLMWPCFWGLGLAAPELLLHWEYVLLFFVGALCMRSAGCIINDIVDRDIDPLVERTKTRPIAAKEISARHAAILTAILCAVAGAFVILLAPILIPYCVAAMGLVIAYPFMKRITWWPQAFLGLTFNCGALFGWIIAQGHIEWPALALYLAGICWTIGYDTIYAHQDIEDDLSIGVKSTAIRFGKYSKQMVAIFYALALAFLMLAGALQSLSMNYFLALLLTAGAHLGWQILTLDIKNTHNCLERFKSNQWFGAIVAFCILITPYI